jgi:hypothetical protein
MTVSSQRSPLVAQVLAGGNRELQMLAADGLLPLPAAEVLALQVELACGPDAPIAERALAALRAADKRVAAEFLAQDADADALALFAAEVRHPLLLEAILRRRDAPAALLAEMARTLPTDLQEVLLLRQDAIVAEPAILEALESNPALSAYSERRIGEYREHLLPRQPAAGGAPAGEEGAVAEEPAELDAELRAAISVALQSLPAGEQDEAGEVDEVTGLSEGQVRLLALPLRLRLARGAPRSLRSILVRDVHPQVAVSVLQNNPVSDPEVEAIARNRSVLEEVLSHIAKHREWSRKYPIILALVNNPRTPVAASLRLLPRIGVRDLRNMGRDRNLPDAVRSLAQRLYRIKVR